MATPTFFNAAFYLETYPDLVANGITLETAFDHFQQFGETELRVPSAEYVGKVNTSSVFDYVMANADLRAAFGVAEDATALTKEQQNNGIVHYWTFGVNEDRPDALIDYVPGPTPVETDLGAALEAITVANTELTATTKEVKEALDIVGTVNDASIKAAIQGKLDVVNAKGGFTVNPDATPTAKAAIIKAKQVELDAAEDVAKIQVTSTPGLQGKAQALASAQSAYESQVMKAAGNIEGFQLAVDTLVAKGIATEVVIAGANGNKASLVDNATFKITVTTGGNAVVYQAVNGKLKADFSGFPITTEAEIKAKAQAQSDMAGFENVAQGLYDNAVAFSKDGAAVKSEATLKTAIVNVLDVEKPIGTVLTSTLTAASYPLVVDGAKIYGADDTTKTTELFGTDAVNLYTAATLTQVAANLAAVKALEITDATSQTFNAKALEGVTLKSANYTKAVKDAADFKAAAADYNDVAKYEADFTKATKAAEAAKDALVTQAEAEGVTLLIEGQDSATEGNDLFVNGGTTPATIFDFGKEGEDMFYFGPEFSFVRLADDAKLGTEVHGNATALEVFAQQVGNDVILSVELEAISGSSTKGFTGSEIKLAGVSLEDLNFADGFLTA